MLEERAITNNFDHSMGALQIVMDTLDGSPMDWEFVIFLASQMLQLTQKGWTGHFMGAFTDIRTKKVVFVTLQAVTGTGASSIAALLLGSNSASQSFRYPAGLFGGAPAS